MPFDAQETSAGFDRRLSRSNQKQQVTILLDRSHYIAFTSSAIQSWLGHDYEALPGLPVTTLIPNLQSFPEWERYCMERPYRLYRPWNILAFVRHADGRHLPAMVRMPVNDNARSTALLRLLPVSQA